MHYLDPDRPRLHIDGGLPLFEGKKVALPALYLAPRGTPDHNWIEVSAFFPMPSGGASRRELKIRLDEFPTFWSEWLANPEGIAKDRFGWQGLAPILELDFSDLFGDLP
jgi:hypothetical protein